MRTPCRFPVPSFAEADSSTSRRDTRRGKPAGTGLSWYARCGTNGDVLLRNEQLGQERHGCEFAGCVVERCARPIGEGGLVDAILAPIVHNECSIKLTGNSMRRAVQLPPLPGATATPDGRNPRPARHTPGASGAQNRSDNSERRADKQA